MEFKSQASQIWQCCKGHTTTSTSTQVAVGLVGDVTEIFPGHSPMLQHRTKALEKIVGSWNLQDKICLNTSHEASFWSWINL